MRNLTFTKNEYLQEGVGVPNSRLQARQKTGWQLPYQKTIVKTRNNRHERWTWSGSVHSPTASIKN